MHNFGRISCAIILICLLTTAVCPTTTATRKIGIGPARINFPEVLRNSDYRITVFIYNGNDYEMNASLGISGEVKDWITFFNKNDTENPITSLLLRNESTTSVVMQLTVPENVSNGHYTGEIYAEMQPLKIEGEENETISSVTIRMPALVSLNVTGTQNLNITVDRVQITPAEINYPMPILIDITNTGNVIATPYLNITVTKDGMYSDQYSTLLNSIQPRATSYERINWDTTGKIAGTYEANITITLDEKVILMNNYPFELLPPGTFTMNGTLKDLSISGTLEKNSVIKIEATFQNTGEVETKAKFIGEIYKDGKLFDGLESEEHLVPKYTTHTLSSYLTLGGENGRYTIEGYVLYGGRETNTKKISFEVGTSSSLPLETIALVAGILGMITLFYILQKKELIQISKIKTMAKRAAKIILFPVKVKKKISVKTSIRPKKKYHTKIWKRKHRVRIGGRKINKTRKKRSAIRKIRLVRIRIRKSKPSKSPTDLRK